MSFWRTLTHWEKLPYVFAADLLHLNEIYIEINWIILICMGLIIWSSYYINQEERDNDPFSSSCSTLWFNRELLWLLMSAFLSVTHRNTTYTVIHSDQDIPLNTTQIINQLFKMKKSIFYFFIFTSVLKLVQREIRTKEEVT